MGRHGKGLRIPAKEAGAAFAFSVLGGSAVVTLAASPAGAALTSVLGSGEPASP